MTAQLRLRLLTLSLAVTPLAGGGLLLQGCQPGSEITEYQAPAQILRSFRTEHPAAQAVSYRQMTKDGFKVYQVQYLEGEEEKEAWYNVQGKPFVSKAERRVVEQERLKQQEENEAKSKDDSEESAVEVTDKTSEHRTQKATPETTPSSPGHPSVP